MLQENNNNSQLLVNSYISQQPKIIYELLSHILDNIVIIDGVVQVTELHQELVRLKTLAKNTNKEGA